MHTVFRVDSCGGPKHYRTKSRMITDFELVQLSGRIACTSFRLNKAVLALSIAVWCSISPDATASQDSPLGLVLQVTNQRVVLRLSGSPGSSNLIQFADSLGTDASWQPLTNLLMPSGVAPWLDLTSTQISQRFYRAVELSQPATVAPRLTTFVINQGAAVSSNRMVVLDHTLTGTATHYMASEKSTFAGASWQVYSPSPACLLSASNGLKTVHFKVKNDAGASAALKDSITLNEPLILVSLDLNQGAGITIHRQIILNHVCTGTPTHYAASERADFRNTTWMAYTPTPIYFLSPTNGPKTVFFRIKSPQGVSATLQDSIVLDEVRKPVLNSFTINNGAVSTDRREIALNSVCANHPKQYMASERADFAESAWLAYATNAPFTLSPTNGAKRVYFKVRNEAGESSTRNDAISLRIEPTNHPPSLASIDFQFVDPGGLVGFQLVAFDSDLPAQSLRFALESGAPGGATVDPTNGWFAWMTSPEQAGVFHLTARVIDNGDPPRSATVSFTIQVGEPAEPLPDDFSPKMIWINPGTFLMGSPPTESARSGSEGPQTVVRLTRGFWIGACEVTQKEYQAVMADNPSRWKSDPLPVNSVSWHDATNYCRWLTERERAGHRLPPAHCYRLPTEAEWELACRATTTTPFGIGNGTDLSPTQANFAASNSFGMPALEPSFPRTTPVGSYPSNAWGLFDTHGNVWEWCGDWFGPYPGAYQTNWAQPIPSSYRVVRGGSWDSSAGDCRSAARGQSLPVVRYSDLGFRVVLAPNPENGIH
jgi:formylglycine-generating enzyme required for sulfatase activity